MRHRVACRLQHPRQRRRLRFEPVRDVALRILRHPDEVAVDAIACREMPGHHCGATRRIHTDGDREACEIRSLARESVYVGRLYLRMSVA